MVLVIRKNKMKFKWKVTITGNDTFSAQCWVTAVNIYDALVGAEQAKSGFENQTIEQFTIVGVEREDCPKFK